MRLQLSSRLPLLAVAAALTACAGEGDVDVGQAEAPLPEGVYGQAPAAQSGVRSVVLLWPADLSAAPAPARETPLIDQFGLVFSPERLIVSPGETMSFANSESALSHNVQVWPVGAEIPILDSDALPEDVIDFVLEPGGYDILCDEHPGMRAFVFATDAPWAVFAEEDGAFELGVVPEGPYRIGTWTIDEGFSEPIEIDVTSVRTGVDLSPSGDAAGA
ncbi:MAG: hypothetical protein AAF389_02140 [Gemmatimonadota bacterium]